MNKEEFINELKKLNININQEQIDKLNTYRQFLIEYNQHTNLTAIKDEEQIYLKHFYDSLTITKVIDLNEDLKIIDVGTGAGFPGMVLKIIFPRLKLTLLDSNNKKITFLKQLADKLEIKDIDFFNGRVEDFTKYNRESFDIVTARAVSNLSVLAELCIPLVKINGYFIPMKGSNIEEIEEGTYAINELGGQIIEINKIILPFENSERNILKIKKITKTNPKYPRRYDKIIKNPLKKNEK